MISWTHENLCFSTSHSTLALNQIQHQQKLPSSNKSLWESDLNLNKNCNLWNLNQLFIDLHTLCINWHKLDNRRTGPLGKSIFLNPTHVHKNYFSDSVEGYTNPQWLKTTEHTLADQLYDLETPETSFGLKLSSWLTDKLLKLQGFLLSKLKM